MKRNVQAVTDTLAGRVTDGDTCRVHGVVSTSTGNPLAPQRPLPLKKTRDRATSRNNSCGIANEPAGHPNDG